MTYNILLDMGWPLLLIPAMGITIGFVIVGIIVAVVCIILIRKMIQKRRDEKYYEEKAQ